MFEYTNRLQYPVRIKNPNPVYAKIIISQLGGPDGELAASTRYLSQRFTMPYSRVIGTLTDIGVEELSHVEMVSAILYQLTRNLSIEEIKKSGFDTYFVDHTSGIYPIAASGVPFRAEYIGVKGDVFADLNEDLAADAAMLSMPDLCAYLCIICIFCAYLFNSVFVNNTQNPSEILDFLLYFAVSFLYKKKSKFCIAYLFSLCYNTDIQFF